jgi:hypothetical protein
MTPGKRYLGLGVVLFALAVASPQQASACDGSWLCGDRAFTSRWAPRAYGYRYRHGHAYRARRRGYGYRGAGWRYGYTSPARAYGDPYAAWSSTSIPASRWYLNAAPPIVNSGAVVVMAPTFTNPGPLTYGEVGRGPSLFGTETTSGYSSGYGYVSGYRRRHGYRGGYGYTGGYGGTNGGYGYYSGTFADRPTWAWRTRRR